MKLKIRELLVGDGVELLTFPPGYPFGETTRSVGEVELAEVIGEDGGSPFTVESPAGCCGPIRAASESTRTGRSR